MFKSKSLDGFKKIKIVTKQKTFKIECNDSEVDKIFEIIKNGQWLDLGDAIINTKDIVYAMVM